MELKGFVFKKGLRLVLWLYCHKCLWLAPAIQMDLSRLVKR